MTERERFFEALPFFVNGTLAAHEHVWLREHLDQHPELQPQLVFMQTLQREVQDAASAALQDVPNDRGYAALRQRIESELRPAAPSFGQRVRQWLAAPSPQGWRLAQGLAMGAMLSLGVLLAIQQGEGEAPIGVRGGAPALADGPLLRVSFDATASEMKLRLALIEARALIVAGPTRLGDYYLKPAPGQLANTRESLLRSGVALQADEVPGLPAELTE
jgi:hypothetical protein